MNFRRTKPSTRTYGRRGLKAIERKYPDLDWIWVTRWPAYHDILYHRRPPRRKDKALANAIRDGRLDADCACWPDWRKPHKYYW